MHIYTHLKPASVGKTAWAWRPMAWLNSTHGRACSTSSKDLGIEDNTIVLFTTDNGPKYSLAGRGTTPFRGEKNTIGKADPRSLHDPLAGVIKPGTEINGVVSHEDWFRPLWLPLANRMSKKAADRVRCGRQDLQNHLDGYNLTDYLAAKLKTHVRSFFTGRDRKPRRYAL